MHPRQRLRARPPPAVQGIKYAARVIKTGQYINKGTRVSYLLEKYKAANTTSITFKYQHLKWEHHYNDVIMGAIASQNTSLTIVYSTVYSGADQGKHESSASLAFVRGIHRGPVNSPHKWPVTRKMSIWWRHHVKLDLPLRHGCRFLRAKCCGQTREDAISTQMHVYP